MSKMSELEIVDRNKQGSISPLVFSSVTNKVKADKCKKIYIYIFFYILFR